MCFTPAVSFLTFAIEILMAAWVLYLNPKERINRVSAAVLFFLGMYQFTEWGLCSAGDPFWWGKLGFIFYTTLPALAVHWVYALRDDKRAIWPVHFVSAGFILYALLASDFVNTAECGRFFVKVLHNWLPMLYWPYFTYYTLFIAYPAVMLLNSIIHEDDKPRRRMYVWGLVGMLAFTFPTFFVLLVLPEFNLFFPSMLCQFALLFAISVAYVVSLNEKIKKVV